MAITAESNLYRRDRGPSKSWFYGRRLALVTVEEIRIDTFVPPPNQRRHAGRGVGVRPLHR